MRSPYHLVDLSPWPIFMGGGVLSMALNLVSYSWFENSSGVIVSSFIFVSMLCYQWWRDVSREGTLMGCHNSEVQLGLKVGSLLFIVSEVMFFVSFFWGWSHSSLAPNIELGLKWPPYGVFPFDYSGIPLLNTVILVSSGVTLTWAHYNLLKGKEMTPLGYTLMLGFLFTFLQGYEYFHASYTSADSVYGSFFFLATGFHGLHVIIGASFLAICLARYLAGQYGGFHHIGYESSCWYWHFVDVVWLFLYLMIYWWGS